MPTQSEITLGTNAAIPAATQFIDSKIPPMFVSQVNPMIPQLVAIVVAAALGAVDLSRAQHSQRKAPKMLPGWKTLIFGLIVAGAGVLQTFNWATVIPQDQTWSGYVMVLIGGLIVFLRYVTTTPIATTPAQVVDNVKRKGTIT